MSNTSIFGVAAQHQKGRGGIFSFSAPISVYAVKPEINIIFNQINQRFYRSETLSDIAFQLQARNGNDERIPAHRVILALRSPAFQRMFANASPTGPTVVTITESSAEVFADFLKFFYLSKFEVAIENVGEVLKLMNDYDADEFWPICDKWMVDTLTSATAYRYYELALSFNQCCSIGKKSDELIRMEFVRTLKQSDVCWNPMIFKKFLSLDTLHGCEKDIFDAVFDYTERSLERDGKSTTVADIKMMLGDFDAAFAFH